MQFAIVAPVQMVPVHVALKFKELKLYTINGNKQSIRRQNMKKVPVFHKTLCHRDS